MTMILGFNLGDKSYISADTRLSKNKNPERDDLQKIVFGKQGLIIAAAGSKDVSGYLAKKILLRKLNLALNLKQLTEVIETLISEYVDEQYKKYTENGLNIPNSLLDENSDVILLVQNLNDTKVSLTCYKFSFVKNGIRKIEIEKQKIKKGEYIKIGKFHEKSPIKKAPIPTEKMTSLSTWNKRTLQGYLEVTNDIFAVALNYNESSIGGKTISVSTFYEEPNKWQISGIRGFKSVVHEEDEFQDVSVVTELNLKTGKFFFRDMRTEGRIVTHLKFKDGHPILYFDSCPKDIGEKDKDLLPFTEPKPFGMGLEL